MIQSINDKLSRIQRISERYQENSNVSVNGISFKDDIMESIKQAKIASLRNQTQINDSQEEDKNPVEEVEEKDAVSSNIPNIPNIPNENTEVLVPVKIK